MHRLASQHAGRIVMEFCSGVPLQALTASAKEKGRASFVRFEGLGFRVWGITLGNYCCASSASTLAEVYFHDQRLQFCEVSKGFRVQVIGLTV